MGIFDINSGSVNCLANEKYIDLPKYFNRGIFISLFLFDILNKLELPILPSLDGD